MESDYVIALNHSKEVYGWGASSYSNIERTSNYPYKQNISNIEKLATYSYSVYMINSEGKLYVSGYNNNCQLGTGSSSSQNKTIVSQYKLRSSSSTSASLRDLPKITNVFPFYDGCAIIDEGGYVYLTGYHGYLRTLNSSPSISDYSRYGIFIEATNSNHNTYFIQETDFSGIEKVIGMSNNILFLRKEVHILLDIQKHLVLLLLDIKVTLLLVLNIQIWEVFYYNF